MSDRDPMRWMWRGVVVFTLLVGWAFILWHNKFNVTVPVVMIGLGYLAAVATIATLWKVGAAAVEPIDDSPEQWARPMGPRVDLEKEKKTLLKAIKEAEFDHAMGKLSKADVDDMIRTYRARAIEIIKQLEALDAGHTSDPREQIRREVQARLALDKDRKAAKDKKAAPAKSDGKRAARVQDAEKTSATSAKTDAKADVKTDADAKTDATAGDAPLAKADDTPAAKPAPAAETATEPPPAGEAKPENKEATS